MLQAVGLTLICISREVGRICCIYGMSPAVEAVQRKIRGRRARELSKPRDKSIYLDVRSVLVQVANKERAAVAQGLRHVQTEIRTRMMEENEVDTLQSAASRRTTRTSLLGKE